MIVIIVLVIVKERRLINLESGRRKGKMMATLLELKMRKMELRDKMDEERRDGGGISVETGTEYGRLIDRLQKGERKLHKKLVWPVLLLFILLLLNGCTSSATLGVSSSVYYPKKWESPASRKQHTQPTVGMARNNLPMVGDAK